MTKVRVKEAEGKRDMYLVEDKRTKEHFCYGKETWLFGEYAYVRNGILFADRADAELYQFFLRTEIGRMLAHRLKTMEKYNHC